jgi:putative ABC transport system permease protein
MLWKLAITGIKSRLRDYLVLLSGLAMASAIFYMFEALALNKSFVTSNSPVSMAFLVFQFGSVLLAIITFIYLLYANNFLLSMRQRDYGLFMVLGAKGRKLGQLIFIETLVIGSVATVLGLVVGLGLTELTGHLLLSRMHLAVHHFTPFYGPAIIATLLFFGVLFLLAAVVNQVQLRHTPVLTLLHRDAQPTHLQRQPRGQFVQSLLGLILLAIGYWSMIKIDVLKMSSIGIALVTIVAGTFLLFRALFTWCLQLLKRRERFAYRGLNNFVLAQLQFRLHDLNRMLTLVTLLFALALGALTVGMGFQSQLHNIADVSPYDVVLHDPTTAQQKKAAQLDIKRQWRVDYKVVKGTVYFNQSQFTQPLLALHQSTTTSQKPYKEIKQADLTMAKQQKWQQTLNDWLRPNDYGHPVRVVDATAYQALQGPKYRVVAIQTKNFYQALPQIKKLVLADSRDNHFPSSLGLVLSKYQSYELMNSLVSGLEFMGFFLGIAFLAMLASCLMFKILAGAANDRRRYQMLGKIGTRKKLLRRSVNREIGVLFALPAVLGVVHVLFGLQLFEVSGLLTHPYRELLVPFSVFGILYLGYYALTVKLYQHLVLPKFK